jgi:hypothetical protein
MSLSDLLQLIAIVGVLLGWLVPGVKAAPGNDPTVAWLAFLASTGFVAVFAFPRYGTAQALVLVAATVATTAMPLLLLRGDMPYLFPKYGLTIAVLAALWVMGRRRPRRPGRHSRDGMG